MIEFLHTADWHLGNPFSSFTRAERGALTDGRYTAVERLLAYAQAEGINLLLVSGDQIDNGELREPGALLRLFGVLARFPKVQCILIAGNHDPLTASSIYNRVDPGSFPANARLVRGNEVIEVHQAGGAAKIFASSLAERYGSVNPIIACAAPAAVETAHQEGSVAIGLAHGAVALSEKITGDDFPIPPALPEASGLDYLALGHWHSHMEISPRCRFPGTHEPLAFGDDCGALRVQIEGPGALPVVSRVDLSVFRWLSIEREVDDASLPDLLSQIDGLEGDHLLASLDLSGYLSVEGLRMVEERTEVKSGSLFKLLLSSLPSIRPSDEELGELSGEGYLSRVIDRLRRMRAEAEDAGAAAASELSDPAASADAALLRVYEFLRASGPRRRP